MENHYTCEYFMEKQNKKNIKKKTLLQLGILNG